MYIWEISDWPAFQWDETRLSPHISEVNALFDTLRSMTTAVGFPTDNAAPLEALSASIIDSSAIEGIGLNADEVRSSIAWQLGIPDAGVPSADRYIEGMVEVTIDATHNCHAPLTHQRLYDWHTALFPPSRSNSRLTIGQYRQQDIPMRVVSGRIGNERIHFEAPPQPQVQPMMQTFIDWVNTTPNAANPLLVPAIAHLWFVTIHPFSDGNGRIARAITDMLLARADRMPMRYYSLSAQIAAHRKEYYHAIEEAQHFALDITPYLQWYLHTLRDALAKATASIQRTMDKARFWELHQDADLNERQTKVINLLWGDFTGNLTASKWGKLTHCTIDTAQSDITDLVHKGLLIPKSTSGRNTSYQLAI